MIRVLSLSDFMAQMAAGELRDGASEDVVLVTNDTRLINAETSEARAEVRRLADERTAVSLTEENVGLGTSIASLPDIAAARHADFSAVVGAGISPERARQIRHWRVSDNRTWRGVARRAHLAWGMDAKWSPPSNQLAGMALCETAALMLGEAPDAAPWN